ncbi:MAG: hypothetical protein ACYTBJ_19580 [Planctomycetota bacterium]
MKVSYKIINARDFIKAKPTGEIDLEESKKLLGQIAAMASPPAAYEILIDARESYGNLNYADMWELVAELGRHREAFRNKIAFLVRDDEQFDKASFLQLCAKNRGFEVSAFTSFEETINWLHSSGDTEDGGTSCN